MIPATRKPSSRYTAASRKTFHDAIPMSTRTSMRNILTDPYARVMLREMIVVDQFEISLPETSACAHVMTTCRSEQESKKRRHPTIRDPPHSSNVGTMEPSIACPNSISSVTAKSLLFVGTIVK